jgi:hypothetical protein
MRFRYLIRGRMNEKDEANDVSVGVGVGVVVAVGGDRAKACGRLTVLGHDNIPIMESASWEQQIELASNLGSECRLGKGARVATSRL